MNDYLSTDVNYLKVVAREIEVSPFARVIDHNYVEQGVVVKVHGYNLTGLLTCVLDDYGLEEVVKVLNSLRIESEAEIMVTDNQIQNK